MAGICHLYNKVHRSLQNIKLALTSRLKVMHCSVNSKKNEPRFYFA